MKDLLLKPDDFGIYDIDFDDAGDFLLTEGFESAILMSILGEKRADAAEIPSPRYRRGDWSNELNDVVDYEIGSKLWLLDMSRNNQETQNKGSEFIVDGLQWMIDDNLIKDIDVDVVPDSRQLLFNISITKQDNEIETYQFDGFNLTGVN